MIWPAFTTTAPTGTSPASDASCASANATLINSVSNSPFIIYLLFILQWYCRSTIELRHLGHPSIFACRVVWTPRLPEDRSGPRRSKRGSTNTLNSSRLAELLAQTVHSVRLAANAEKRALTVGTFLEHLAVREDLPAPLLRRPGQE